MARHAARSMLRINPKPKIARCTRTMSAYNRLEEAAVHMFWVHIRVRKKYLQQLLDSSGTHLGICQSSTPMMQDYSLFRHR